jgi:hypothetical protein
MHESMPLPVPSFSVFDASLNTVAFAFGPANGVMGAPTSNGFVACPGKTNATFTVAENFSYLEVLRDPLKGIDGLTIEYAHTPIERFQFFVHHHQTLKLKLKMPSARVGVSKNGWLEAEHNEVGHSRFFSQHEWLVILRSQISFQPNNVDGFHYAAKKLRTLLNKRRVFVSI